jgi:hypothetical protein
MPKFRKLPVVIEALHVAPIADLDRRSELYLFLYANADVRGYSLNDDGSVAIETLEGTMTANVGDWIIRGVKGELYPCRDDIFAATYEPVA